MLEPVSARMVNNESEWAQMVLLTSKALTQELQAPEAGIHAYWATACSKVVRFGS
jgi:hypothetical protein